MTTESFSFDGPGGSPASNAATVASSGATIPSESGSPITLVSNLPDGLYRSGADHPSGSRFAGLGSGKRALFRLNRIWKTMTSVNSFCPLLPMLRPRHMGRSS